MFFSLLVGSVMMIFSTAIAIVLFGWAVRMLHWFETTSPLGYQRYPLVLDLSIAGLWILLVLTSCVWGWAGLYMILGLFDSLETALYFSIVSFTTVGYGDVVLEPGWRLLAGMTATHGLITFGLLTAFLVEVFKSPNRPRRS